MDVPVVNVLLGSVPQQARTELLKSSRLVRLRRGRSLYHEGERPMVAYFIETGLASTMIETSAGEQAEVGMIGCEGVVGLATVLGPAPNVTRCLTQMDSTALEVPMEALCRAFEQHPPLRSRLLEFGQAYLYATERVAACNRIHLAPERMVRWLLMAQLYGKVGRLPFTHDFLAQMLAVQRTTISAALNSLQAEGLIEHGWGSVTIHDRAGLEARCCNCYSILKKLYVDLYRNSSYR